MSIKGVDEAFRGAGAKTGLEIWCVHNQQLVPIPRSSHGKFFSGSSYVILSTVVLRSGSTHYDIHYWVGKDAKEDEAAMASDKAMELDAALGSRSVQYREVQGCETPKFLSYFKPCIIPIEGVFSLDLHALESESYPTSLFSCKGDRAVHVKEVPFMRSSLNHDDVFILDTRSKIFLFSGCSSSIQERAKALEVVNYIKENKHGGICELATIDDGKLVGDSDAGEFWSFFGGYVPITRDPHSTNQKETRVSSTKLFWIRKGDLCPMETPSLEKGMLSSDKCYMLDCDAEIFVWMGKATLVSERKASISAIEEIVRSQGRSTSTTAILLTEGAETAKFKSYFSVWPQGPSPSLYQEGRGKVAAIFKHQGYDVKELPEADTLPLIDCTGNLKVWRVDRHEILLVPAAEQGKFYSGDCFIAQYVYPGSGKDEHLFYAWLGNNSSVEDRADCITQMISLVDSLKGRPVMAQVYESKEPKLFSMIVKSLIIFKGGRSSGYKMSISERGITDETFDTEKIALFRVQESTPGTVQAIQTEPISTSLNSSYCYILQDGAFIFTWTGTLSSLHEHDHLNRMVDQLNWSVKQVVSLREGSEPDVFWRALGGKVDYPRERNTGDFVDDPHLFSCIYSEGEFKAKEIFSFTQDDLTTEDVLVLDCHDEIYVWVGHHSNYTSKAQALALGKKFLETDILLEGLSSNSAIYVIAEGNEPPFFTCFFEWDTSKPYRHGNSFERKLAVLKGLAPNIERPLRGLQSSFGRYSSEHTSVHSGRKIISPFSSNKKSGFSVSMAVKESPSSNEKMFEAMFMKDEVCDQLESFPYELLKVPLAMPKAGMDITKREYWFCEHSKTVVPNFPNQIPRCVKWILKDLGNKITTPILQHLTMLEFDNKILSPTLREVAKGFAVSSELEGDDSESNQLTSEQVGESEDPVTEPEDSDSNKSDSSNHFRICMREDTDVHVLNDDISTGERPQGTTSTEAELQQKEEVIMKQKEEINKLEKELFDAQCDIMHLKDATNSQQKNLDERDEIIANQESLIIKLEKELSDARNDINKLKDANAQASIVDTATTDRIHELERINAEKDAQIKQQEVQIKELTNELIVMKNVCIDDTVHVLTQFASAKSTVGCLADADAEPKQTSMVKRIKKKGRKSTQTEEFEYAANQKRKGKMTIEVLEEEQDEKRPKTDTEDHTGVLNSKNKYKCGKYFTMEAYESICKVLEAEGNFGVVWRKEKGSLNFVTVEDIMTVLEETYIPNTVIDAWGTLLTRNVNFDNQSYFVDSCCWKLCMDFEKDENYDNFISKAVIQAGRNVQHIFFPMVSTGYNPNRSPFHWTLLVLDTHNGSWKFYNSMRPRKGHKDTFFADAKKLKEYMDKCLQPKDVSCSETRDLHRPIRNVPNIPQQKPDSNDCAIFVCYFMQQLAFHKEINYTITDEEILKLKATIASNIVTENSI